MLIVLRGNSGSGKSTVARMLQARLGNTALLQQDHFRRVIFNEKEQVSMAHAELLETAAVFCLRRDHHVVLDGIFDATRCEVTLMRIAASSDDARFFSFDLTFEETLRRHAARAETCGFTADDMRGWYHGWQPLSAVDEERITADETPEGIVERILA
ncbi:kinase [Microbacterium sp. 4R-513]|uniref:AAA family ATPase n=1 Tax=Microbacterium sp. 4R-513 TaxID=2567934 RepID=UPI0013E13D72|nr:AAA family ATPase [Microbacterium sp. 4R-513]QIG40424.1 kinase [Microbacterium sp. 4R-513]